MDKKYKYRMKGGAGYPVSFDLDKTPVPGLAAHMGFPENLTSDVIAFTAKYVESFGNLNRAYFANQELVSAYHTIPYKAIDVEHELEDVVGHIHSHAYIDRTKNEMIDYERLATMAPEELIVKPMDVLVGSIVYVDRFPRLEGPIERKSFAISMECFFTGFDVLLENGLLVTLEEAEALGLGLFVEQLMGEYETEEEFRAAHTLRVQGFDPSDKTKSKDMKIYKYLKDIMFSGGGLVLNPACPSCHILTTDRDESCECSEKTGAEASVQEFDPEFILDLTKVESFVKAKREGKEGKRLNHPVPDDLDKEEAGEENKEDAASGDNTGDPRTGPFSPTGDQYDTGPSICPNYKPEYTADDGLTKRQWCTYASETCPTAADRTWKDCHRWFRKGEEWFFDKRAERDPNYVYDEGPVPVNESTPSVSDERENKGPSPERKVQVIKNLLNMFEFFLEARTHTYEEKEEAATWTTKFINGLPNSSFAVVEKGYKAGESPKSARHLPYKDGSGKVDLPHLRNAMARANQIKSVLGTESDADLRSRARSKLEPVAKKYLGGDNE